MKSETKEGQTVKRSEQQESKKDRVGKLEPKKKKAKVKAEVSAEEALGEKEAKWAKAREVPGTGDESGSYSYEEDEGECSVDWGGDDADRRSRTPEGRRPGVILKSKGYLELEARMADPAGEGSAADTQPGTAGASGTTDTQDAQVPAGASGTADSQANPASSAGRLDTASRRKAIEEDIKEHGAVVCPRCDARNATWRLKCYRCGLERPNPKRHSPRAWRSPQYPWKEAGRQEEPWDRPGRKRGRKRGLDSDSKLVAVTGLVGVPWFPKF